MADPYRGRASGGAMEALARARVYEITQETAALLAEIDALLPKQVDEVTK